MNVPLERTVWLNGQGLISAASWGSLVQCGLGFFSGWGSEMGEGS